MRKIILFLTISIFTLFVNVSCNKKENITTQPPVANTVDVSILAMSYSPATVTVARGTIVKWTNTSGSPHTVTADNNTTFNSPTLAPGNMFSVTTATVGTFPYHCLIHGISMSGTLEVTN
ncbi:MAG: plastocyanin/azurin family copper-binding protein [Ferruginibacter sp.]